jgi:3-oxoacyl-[acyl-carrier-protein] synthase II
MSSRRVVITGVGGLCCLGLSAQELWSNALEGRTVAEKIPQRWFHFNDFRSNVWAPLPAIDYQEHAIPKVDLLRTDPVALNQFVTAREAFNSAGFSSVAIENSNNFHIPELTDRRCGIYLGNGGGGGMHSSFTNHSVIVLKHMRSRLGELLSDEQKQELGFDLWTHPKKLNSFVVPMIMGNAISAYLGIRYSLHGPNHITGQACSAGSSAIALAYRKIKTNEVDVAICGGSEYLNDDYGASFKGFDAAGTLTTLNDDPKTANRPFDKNRKGFLFAEGGAATLVLEELEQAKARGANIIAEISGAAETFDAFNMMRPDPESKQATVAVKQAMEEAGLRSEQIGYINTHGTGTPTNDEPEALMLRALFPHGPHVNATKSLTGHSIGASGALEALITALSLKEGRTHGCANLDDPVVELNFCKEAKTIDAEHAISQSFAFGGHNVALAFSKYK